MSPTRGALCRDNSGEALGTPDGRDQPQLSVVVPMYQEAARIDPTLRDIVKTLDSWAVTSEVIVVDDGSTDGCGDLVRDIAAKASASRVRIVTQPRNMGKGAAVRCGFEEARGAWILFMDADNSARLAELPKLATAANRASAALAAGSRNSPDSEVQATFSRRASGLIFRSILCAMGLGFVSDTQCGFKLYRRDAAELCARCGEEDGFAFDIEHLGLCQRAGLGIVEVGIRWEHCDGGAIRVVRDGVRMVRQAVRIRARLRSAPAPTRELSQILEFKPSADTAPAARPRGKPVMALEK